MLAVLSLFSLTFYVTVALRMPPKRDLSQWADDKHINDHEEDESARFTLDGEGVEARFYDLQSDVSQVQFLRDTNFVDKDGSYTRDFIKPVAQEFSTWFRKKHNPEQWEKLYASAAERGKQNPCKAAVKASIGFNNNAYGSSALLFLNQVALAVYQNKSIALCGSMYEGHFWRPNFDTDQLGRCPSRDCGKRAMADAQLGNLLSRGLFMQDKVYLANLKRFLYSKFYTFKPEVAKELQAAMQSQGIESSKYIGMHIRHGDKTQHEGHVNIAAELYASQVPKLLTSDDESIYLASDDGSAKPRVQKYLQETKPKVSVYTNFDPRADKGYRGLESKTMSTLLLDIYALNHADAFVGTQSSNMGVATYYARPADNRTIFVDHPYGTWGWL